MKDLARLLAAAAALLLLGCEKPTPPGKVALLVNGQAVSVDQVRLQRAAMASRDAKQAIEKLIDRRLLVQRALENKLDEHPRVAAALAQARDEVLLRAYVERISSASYTWDPKEIEAFHDANPALFAERRVYRLFEVTAAVQDQAARALRRKARTVETLYDVADWLKRQDIPFNIGATTRAAEELPGEALSLLAAMRDGEMTVFEVPGGLSVVQLVYSELKPVAERDAHELIRRRFVAGAGMKAALEELAWLRSQAKIEYLIDRTP